MKGLHADFLGGLHPKGCQCDKCVKPKYLSEQDRESNLRHTLVSLISLEPGITTTKLWKKVERLVPAYTIKEFEKVLKLLLGDEAHCTNSRWWLK